LPSRAASVPIALASTFVGIGSRHPATAFDRGEPRFISTTHRDHRNAPTSQQHKHRAPDGTAIRRWPAPEDPPAAMRTCEGRTTACRKAAAGGSGGGGPRRPRGRLGRNPRRMLRRRR
jgi:hypothetical protein